jgi:hypothetical protein
MVEKAKVLRTIVLHNKDHEEIVRYVADCYVNIAEENRKAYDEFGQKYGHLFPPSGE